MAKTASRIREVDDIEQLILNRSSVGFLGDLENLPAEEVAEAALNRLCCP